MRQKFINYLIKLDLYDYSKIFKDKLFTNPLEKHLKRQRFQFYSQFIKKDDLCFDIGGSYGNRTEVFLKIGAKVVTVEPQKFPARYLKRKFKDEIILINKALGEKNEFRKMLVSEYSALSSLSSDWVNKVSEKRFDWVKWNKEVDIELITLDKMISDYGLPNFCKIDVEGYEFEVLKGLSQPLQLLSFEFTIPEFKDEAINCVRYLNSLGPIVCNYSADETLEFGLVDWLPPSEFINIFKELDEMDITCGDIYIKSVV